ncbi:MAG: T9SS type A sorting domain-containing protein [Bacteroidales bacterium]|nr:T9SS type A sorting domain-containing protein [Bacteroidales bacterium]
MKMINFKDFPTKILLTPIFLVLITFSTNSQAYKVRMAFIGNSITQGVYGYGLSNADTSYATQFGNLMETIYGDTLEILNAGVSGRTMLKTSSAPIWSESIFATALKTVPDICLIMLGTNDSKPDLLASVEERFLDDYLSMIDTFRFRNPDTKFIVCDPTPIWGQHPYSSGNPHHDTILVNYTIPLIDSVAKMKSTYLLDLHTPFVDSVQYTYDSLHPNGAGHKKMAQILFNWFLAEDLMHKVDAGRAYVSNFYQVTKPAAVGSDVELRWSTIFADSVFLDGVQVDSIGSKVVVAESRYYVLTAKGSKNSSDFPLLLSTYVSSKDPIAKTNLITVYPNPVYDKLTLQLENLVSNDLKITIYNVLGDKVFEKSYTINTKDDSIIELNTSGFAQGSYIYSISVGNDVSSGRFIKYANMHE